MVFRALHKLMEKKKRRAEDLRDAIKAKRVQVDALSGRTSSIEKALEDIRNRLSSNLTPVTTLDEKRERLELFNVCAFGFIAPPEAKNGCFLFLL